MPMNDELLFELLDACPFALEIVVLVILLFAVDAKIKISNHTSLFVYSSCTMLSYTIMTGPCYACRCVDENKHALAETSNPQTRIRSPDIILPRPIGRS